MKIECTVWKLFQTVDTASENSRQNFDNSSMSANLESLGLTSLSFANDSLLVIRSCILLQFCFNVLLVIVNTQGEDVSEGEGEENDEDEKGATTSPSALVP